ncbi:hypothetical protein C8R48DRAFT_705806 [Suillus tomentosus]|nr:hypothetical protein C8R48DRAFT_705806 [Suillus tomentosus]
MRICGRVLILYSIYIAPSRYALTGTASLQVHSKHLEWHSLAALRFMYSTYKRSIHLRMLLLLLSSSSLGNIVRMSQGRHTLECAVYSRPCVNESVRKLSTTFSSVSP